MLYKETKQNYNDKEKTKRKGRKKKKREETQLMPGIKLRTFYAPRRFVTTTPHGNIL